MMALLSSPMGPPARFDFDQPPSPSYTQEELPADFDRSFGSSMSISSSFDGMQVPQLRLGGQTHNNIFGSSFAFGAGTVANTSSIQAAAGPSTTRTSERASPRQGPSLGAAMGTFLNTRSPGLAAKLSSPVDMDISPPVKGSRSPSQAMLGLMLSLAESRRKSEASSNGPSPLAQGNRRLGERAGPPATSSLGRLFGTELSLNEMKTSEQEDELLSSSDKEPPPKRRPSSLPSRQTDGDQKVVPARPVSLKVNASLASQRSRPALLKCFTEDARADLDSQRASRSGPKHRLSDSSLSTAKCMRKPRSRAASSDSLFCDQGAEAEHSAFDTIIEYPTPSPSKEDGIGGYFFDPQSPAHQVVVAAKKATGLSGGPRPNLMASLSSSPVSSPSNRMVPPRLASLGFRTFEKTHSTACVPTQGSLAVASSRTSLGKRSNPYSKRPSLIPGDRPLKSAYPVLGMPGVTSVTRPTAPAPRRCHSAMDNSSFLSGRSLATLGRIPPASPERKAASMLSYGELADANGSPIAPKSRAKPRPGLRRASKDDSSPLGYGTGLKRSGSRTGENMVDDLGLDEVAQQVGSPFGAEGMPGFGASEKEGKILPCFTVKEDGLVRISSHTLTDLLGGKFDDRITSYNVVDCRFGYEFDGGHVPGAINLGTMEKVKKHFLSPGQGQHANGKALPVRSQSGKPDVHGNLRKHVIVFHCEFSCKRAPSMALALRQADRALAQDYPDCHFPEIYVLQGGYCEYFRTYSSICEPQQYIQMDDPRYQDRRSAELNGFRKQFARHRSFTYGESKNSANGHTRSHLGNPSIQEEDLSLEDSPCAAAGGARLGSHLASGLNAASAVDTSFGSVGDSSFEEEVGNSPCAAVGSRRPTAMLLAGPSFPQPGARTGSLSRRVMQRAGTTANIMTR